MELRMVSVSCYVMMNRQFHRFRDALRVLERLAISPEPVVALLLNLNSK